MADHQQIAAGLALSAALRAERGRGLNARHVAPVSPESAFAAATPAAELAGPSGSLAPELVQPVINSAAIWAKWNRVTPAMRAQRNRRHGGNDDE